MLPGLQRDPIPDGFSGARTLLTDRCEAKRLERRWSLDPEGLFGEFGEPRCGVARTGTSDYPN